VADGAAYRLSGDRGTAQQVTIMAFTQTMQGFDPFDLSDVARGQDRHFDVLLSSQRPADHRGDWWQLRPGTASLWVRSLSDRWGQEQEPRIAIERLGVPSRRRTRTETIAANLANLATIVDRTVTYGIDHTDALYKEGAVNRLKMADYTSSGAMPAQWYHEGIFELSEDEALIVEARLPAGCDYFSWSLTDRMLVTLDWTHAQTSLNRTQAGVDDDGVLRVVVAKSDPGIRNWMDTTGYDTGVLQCRAMGSAEPPSISTHVTTLTSVLDHLPASTQRVTPAERHQALQERRTGFQLRQLW
jgi:hypothetical protein